MVAEIIGYVSLAVIMLLLAIAFMFWVKHGGFKELMDSMNKDCERSREQCRKELKAYKKAFKAALSLVELKDLEIEEYKQKEKKDEKDN